MANKIKITQVKSKYGSLKDQQDTLRSLGLKRPHQSVTKELTKSVKGMVFKVKHLVKVEEV
jgi:large subunit ribosomal protein L30